MNSSRCLHLIAESFDYMIALQVGDLKKFNMNIEEFIYNTILQLEEYNRYNAMPSEEKKTNGRSWALTSLIISSYAITALFSK